MVKIGTTAPCLLREAGKPMRFVSVIKDQVKICPSNTLLVQIEYADGVWKWTKRIPKRVRKTAYLHNATVHISPHGFQRGMSIPDSIEFVCTNREECFPELIKRVRLVEEEKLDLLNKYGKLKMDVKEILKEIKTEELPERVQAKIREMKLHG